MLKEEMKARMKEKLGDYTLSGSGRLGYIEKLCIVYFGL